VGELAEGLVSNANCLSTMWTGSASEFFRWSCRIGVESVKIVYSLFITRAKRCRKCAVSDSPTNGAVLTLDIYFEVSFLVAR
jgi:hypothetical protein